MHHAHCAGNTPSLTHIHTTHHSLHTLHTLLHARTAHQPPHLAASRSRAAVSPALASLTLQRIDAHANHGHAEHMHLHVFAQTVRPRWRLALAHSRSASALTLPHAEVIDTCQRAPPPHSPLPSLTPWSIDARPPPPAFVPGYGSLVTGVVLNGS